jgi:hypothetical protein
MNYRILYVSIFTLALTLSAASTNDDQPHQGMVSMSFSGSLTVLPPITLKQPGGNAQPNELTAAGDGSLGPFTVHDVRATAVNPTASGCAAPDNSFTLPFVAVAGLFRFNDGSLLTYKLVDGNECVNLTKLSATVVLHLQITGGTRQLQGASGTLTFTSAPAFPILFDVTPEPFTLAVLIEVPNVVVTGTLVVPKNNKP